VGEDIAWMHLGDDGRLWAVNPEAGVFGVAPGTGPKTNPNMLAAVQHDAIYTNVAMTADGRPWWEGLEEQAPAGLTDWQGRPYTGGNGPAAHPNSRFTVACRQLPTYSEATELPQGVPISAILFGGRRAGLVPLVTQSLDWAHGVFMGASMGSETTAAATGQVGVVRRDPMAMLPFCGYNMAAYWAHWLSFAERSERLPKIFQVNWFRRDADGRFLWPGYGENLRVLRWVLERAHGGGKAERTPIGYLPAADGIDTAGLALSEADLRTLTSLEAAGWAQEIGEIETYFAQFGETLPPALRGQVERIRAELNGG
jgi:phosphoenolpyruvate carboxykinase (GTP)